MKKVSIDPFMLIGLAVRTTNQSQKALEDISALWQRFMAEGLAVKIPNKVDDTIYSLYTDYESDHTKPYTTILGCRVSDLNNIPEGLIGRSFGGGTYVKTSAKGDLMKGMVAKHWAEIWEMDLDRTYTADFEAYGEKSQNPSEAEVDFYVAIEE